MMKHSLVMKVIHGQLVSVLLLLTALVSVASRSDAGTLADVYVPSSPMSLILEHEKQTAEINKAIQSGGKTGMIAQALLEVNTEHVRKEMKFVFPQLSYLPLLAYENIVLEAEEIVRLTDVLRRELATMLAEHRQIIELAQQLRDAAEQEGKRDQVKFADDLVLHVEMQEEIVYPAALLIGEAARYFQKVN